MADDENNPLKALRQEIEQGPAVRREAKANHTLYLSEPQFRIFANYCKFKGFKASAVVDKLISMYLAEVKDDLPPEG